MKIGLKILLIFLLFSIIMTSMFYFIELQRQNETFDLIASEQIQEISNMFGELENQDTKMLSSTLEFAIQDKGLKEAYLKNDREYLYNYSIPLFHNLKNKYGITHFYFIYPDGRVFLRLHDKKIYDDPVNRITFKKANETKELATGLELGKTAFALRAIRPYYDDGNLIGYVELGEEIDYFLKILKGNTSNDFAIIVEKKYLNKSDWISVRKSAGIRNNWDDSEKYLIISSTSEEAIAEKCFAETNLELGNANNHYQRFQSNNRTFICGKFPITDAGGRNIGSVLSLVDMTYQFTILQKSNNTSMGLSAFGFIVTLSIGILITRSITKPIAELMKATEDIGKGNFDTKIDTKSKDEFGVLSRAFNRMASDLERHTDHLDALVTERTLALSESEEKFEGIASTAKDAIILIDNDGKIEYWNDAARRIFGYSKQEMIKEDMHLILAPGKYHNAYRDGFAKLRMTGEGAAIGKTLEFEAKRKDGTLFPIELSVSALKLKGKWHSIGILRDITERKKAEEKIIKLNVDLQRHAVELTAVNKELEAFSYSVSHDLRAPLRTIDGFSQALLEDYADKFDEEGKDHLRRVRAASQRMAQLIDDMLNLSRLSRSEMTLENVDLSAIVKSISDELRETQPQRKVEFVIAQGITAKGDARLLRVALTNLLGNAWKFTGNRSNARIEFGVAQVDGEKSYFITDNGAGFDMAYANKLFGAFQRLHGSTEFPGTGIGLAIVQRVIHRHGGKVWAEGDVEKGATFYFTLGSEQNDGERK